MSKITMTRRRAIEEVCGPGQPYELKTTQICGKTCRVFVNAPATLRELYAGNLSDLDFLIYEEERFSFKQVYRRASALAKALVDDYGIQPGDRVAIAMRNYPEWTMAFFAVTSIGAVAVAINAWWNARELSHSLVDCDPSLIVVDQERLDRLADCEALPADLNVIRVRATENTRLASDNWDNVISAQAGAIMPQATIDPDDDVIIFYTSGSTGYPKGLISTHRAVIHAVLSWELDWELRSQLGVYVPPEVDYQQGLLLTLPMFHVAGCHAAMLAAIRAQRKVVNMYKWDVQLGMELIERERLTVFTATPAISGDLVQASASTDRDISSLLVVGGGGAPRAPEQVYAINQMSEAIIPHTGWGMTETNAIGASNAASDYLGQPSSAGYCSIVLDMRVVDEDGNECPAGERGELQIRGTSMFRDYWKQPETSAEAFDGEWFRTGDAAVFDENRFMYIVDRIKHLVIRGGENIGCGMVEAALVEHPDVIEACVYSVPDERLGEEVGTTLFVSDPVAEDELQEFLSDKLAKFEIPRYIHQQTEVLPRQASGKIFKLQIRSEAITRLGLVEVNPPGGGES